MNGLEEEFGDDIAFYRLDANELEVERFQRELGLRGHPTAALIDENEQVKNRFFGPQTAELLRSELNGMR